MSTATRFVTTAIPMAGFEEESLGDEDIVVHLHSFAQKYISGKHWRSTTLPAWPSRITTEAFYPGTSVLRKVPQLPAIEHFRLPGDPDQPPPLTVEPKFEEALSDHVAVVYLLFVDFTLEALKATVRGEPTRSFDYLLVPNHGSQECPRAAFFEQRVGRVNRVLAVHHPKAENDPQAADPWDRWFTKLSACLELEEGWNGDESPPPDALAVYNASVFLKALQRENCQPTRIAASAMGGTAITRKVRNKKVLVECYNDGRVYFLFSDRESGNMDVKPLLLDQDSLTRFISSMREFLNG